MKNKVLCRPIHGHRCVRLYEQGHAIECDLNEKIVVELNAIDPLILFRWIVRNQVDLREGRRSVDNLLRVIVRNIFHVLVLFF